MMGRCLVRLLLPFVVHLHVCLQGVVLVVAATRHVLFFVFDPVLLSCSVSCYLQVAGSATWISTEPIFPSISLLTELRTCSLHHLIPSRQCAGYLSSFPFTRIPSPLLSILTLQPTTSPLRSSLQCTVYLLFHKYFT